MKRHIIYYFRERRFDGGTGRIAARYRMQRALATIKAILLDAEDAIFVDVELVEGALVLDVENDEHKHRHADGKSGDVDEGINLIFE